MGRYRYGIRARFPETPPRHHRTSPKQPPNKCIFYILVYYKRVETLVTFETLLFLDKWVIPNIIVIWSFLRISLTYRQWQVIETLSGQGRNRGRGSVGRVRAQRYAHVSDIKARVEPEGLEGYAGNVPPVLQPQPARRWTPTCWNSSISSNDNWMTSLNSSPIWLQMEQGLLD